MLFWFALALQESIKDDERKGKLWRGVLMQQYNTPVYINQVAMHAVCGDGCKLLPYPLYPVSRLKKRDTTVRNRAWMIAIYNFWLRDHLDGLSILIMHTPG